MERNTAAERLIIAARELSAALSDLRFAPPVSHVYNPLTYAWSAHADYLQRYGGGKKRVVFLGMNPGPFGMVQCGIPFGEVRLARDWLGIDAPIGKPALLNPHRPVEGWDCRRSEVSGRRLWGLFQQRYGSAAAFFTEHFVVNYCPLAFFDHGRNLTPDKLPPTETASLFAACDEHLRQVITALQPEWLIAVGLCRSAGTRRFGRIWRVYRSHSASESGQPGRQPRLGGGGGRPIAGARRVV